MEHQMDYSGAVSSRRHHRKRKQTQPLPISPPPPQTITLCTFRRHSLHFTTHKWRPLLLPLPLDNNDPHNWRAISIQHRRFTIHTGEFFYSMIIDLSLQSLPLRMMKLLHNDIMLNHMAQEKWERESATNLILKRRSRIMAGITRDLKSFRLYSIVLLSNRNLRKNELKKKIENKSRKNQKGFPFFFLTILLKISLEKGAQQIYVQFSEHKTHK